MSKNRNNKNMVHERWWSEEDFKFLFDNYHSMPVAEIAAKLNRPLDSVYVTARNKGLSKRKVSVFTEDETWFIVNNYSVLPVGSIAFILSRTKQSVNHKAFRCGVTVQKVADWKYCIDCGKRLSRAAIYRDGVERCLECSHKRQVLENHPNWKGGVSSLEQIIYSMLRPVWGKPIMKRDNYTCQKCGKRGGDLHVHHLRFLTQIRDDVLREHPELDLDIPSDKRRAAILIVAEHNLNDGVTLCPDCHKAIHSEKPGELLEPPNVKSRAISSRASEGKGSGEGSTAMSVSPNNNPTHEYPAQHLLARVL